MLDSWLSLSPNQVKSNSDVLVHEEIFSCDGNTGGTSRVFM